MTCRSLAVILTVIKLLAELETLPERREGYVIDFYSIQTPLDNRESLVDKVELCDFRYFSADWNLSQTRMHDMPS